jgi:hypothetical protein
MPEAVAPAPAAPAVEVKPAAPATAPAAAPEPAGLLGAAPAAPAEAPAAAPAAVSIVLPEGVEADGEVLGQFQALAGEAKLDAKQAQKIADLGVAMVQKQAEAIGKAWQDQRAAWVEGLKADPDWGGAKFGATVEDANRALRQFGDAELLNDLKDLGLDNHPGLVRAFARVARATAEDRSIDRPGGRIAMTEKTLGQRLYPEQGKA